MLSVPFEGDFQKIAKINSQHENWSFLIIPKNDYDQLITITVHGIARLNSVN